MESILLATKCFLWIWLYGVLFGELAGAIWLGMSMALKRPKQKTAEQWATVSAVVLVWWLLVGYLLGYSVTWLGRWVGIKLSRRGGGSVPGSGSDEPEDIVFGDAMGRFPGDPNYGRQPGAPSDDFEDIELHLEDISIEFETNTRAGFVPYTSETNRIFSKFDEVQ